MLQEMCFCFEEILKYHEICLGFLKNIFPNSPKLKITLPLFSSPPLLFPSLLSSLNTEITASGLDWSGDQHPRKNQLKKGLSAQRHKPWMWSGGCDHSDPLYNPALSELIYLEPMSQYMMDKSSLKAFI